jgi:hypothetical protein
MSVSAHEATPRMAWFDANSLFSLDGCVLAQAGAGRPAAASRTTHPGRPGDGISMGRADAIIDAHAVNRSGVVNTSTDNSHKRSKSSSSALKASTISSRVLEPMPEILERTTDKNCPSVTIEASVTQGITGIRQRWSARPVPERLYSTVLPECIFNASFTLAFLSSPAPFATAFLRFATTVSTAPLSAEPSGNPR